MEVDFWPSNFEPAAKHFPARQADGLTNSDNYLNIDDSEGDNDAEVFFPCPFCYVDVDIEMLCGHLQEEHCFVLRDAVCPLCAANLGKDIIGHFTVQHAHSVKRRRKCQKSGFWTNNSPAIFGKDLHEPGSFLGSNLINGRGNLHESAPDPLLSPFLFTMLLCDPKDNQQHECSSQSASTTSDMISAKPHVDEIHEEDYEERRQRAAFCQQLIMSTIF